MRSRAPFFALTALLVCALLLGGSSKDHAPGLVLLRPMAVIVFAIGLFSVMRKDWVRFKFPLGLMAAALALVASHLVPLPPSIWMQLPGRELAIMAGEVAGIEQPWRPLSLVPYRGWNAIFALMCPAAVMVCAVQLDRKQHFSLALILVAGAFGQCPVGRRTGD